MAEPICNASAQHPLENAIRVILEKRQNGGAVQTVLGRCAMPVVFVRIVSEAM